jgi:hypothetical protein
MRTNLKVLSHFFEKLDIDLPRFPGKRGKTSLSKPKSDFISYISNSNPNIFGVKISVLVTGTVKRRGGSFKVKVNVVAVGMFEFRGRNKKPTDSIFKRAARMTHKRSFEKLKTILENPYLSYIPFPTANKLKIFRKA